MRSVLRPDLIEARRNINLVIDVLEGCRYNCVGCKVDKQGHALMSDASLDALVDLINDALNNGMLLTELQIGPTDFISSDNHPAVMASPSVQQLIRKAESIVLTCPFIDPRPELYDDLSRHVSAMASGKLVKFITPLAFHHKQNIIQLETIRRNVAYFNKCLPSNIETKHYVVFFLDMTTEEATGFDVSAFADELIIADNTVICDNTHIDFVVPHGRYGYTTDERERFEANNRLLNAALMEVYHRGLSEPAMNDKRDTEGRGWELTYSNGRLYAGVMINEPRFTLTTPFEIPPPWTYASLYDQREERTIQGLMTLSDESDCGQCANIHVCADRGVLHFMDNVGITTCVSNTRHF